MLTSPPHNVYTPSPHIAKKKKWKQAVDKLEKHLPLLPKGLTFLLLKKKK